MHKLDGIIKTLDDVIKDGKEKNAGELLAENDLIIEKTRSVLELCSLYPEFQYIQSRNIVKCTLCAQESEHDMCSTPWARAPERNTRAQLIIKYYILAKNRVCSFWSETSRNVKKFHNFWSHQRVGSTSRPR